MGNGIMAYRVNLDRIKSRFGVTVSSKKSSIRKRCKVFAANIDDLGNDDDPTMMQLVEELLEAKATYPYMGFKYWYAIKGFIEDLGAFLPNYYWYPAGADVFYETSAFKLYDIDAPMKIPSPLEFPVVFVLRNENMNDELLSELEKKILEKDQFYEVKGWIRDAIRYKQDLILYYH